MQKQASNKNEENKLNSVDSTSSPASDSSLVNLNSCSNSEITDCKESNEVNEKAAELLMKAEETNEDVKVEPLIQNYAYATQLFEEIISSSFDYLKTSKDSKIKMRWFQAIFSWCFITIQFIVFTVLIFILKDNHLGIIISFASEMIVQTIGLIVIMIKNTFDDKNESKVIDTINDITNTYSKTAKGFAGNKKK